MDDFYVHTIQVEVFAGVGVDGSDSFLAPVILKGFLSGAQKLIRDASGSQVMSPATFTTYPLYAPAFSLDARITANGVVNRVLMININYSGSLNLPDNVEVNLG